VATKPPGAPDRWLVTLTEVEEVKAVARLLPIMATLIVYNAVYAQVGGWRQGTGEGIEGSMRKWVGGGREKWGGGGRGRGREKQEARHLVGIRVPACQRCRYTCLRRQQHLRTRGGSCA
jgi:hypothetical protein